MRIVPAPGVERPVDTGLVDRCRAGDPSAIERLFELHAATVERVIGRLVGPTADLEDLVQTTFLEAIRNLSRFRGEASLKTWLTSIAVHVAQHHLRAGKVRRHIGLELVPEATLAQPFPTSDRRLDERRLAARLHDLLDRITAKKRVALLLYVIEERSVEEIAALMGASRTATRSRLFFARRELRALIERDPALQDLASSLLGRAGGTES